MPQKGLTSRDVKIGKMALEVAGIVVFSVSEEEITAKIKKKQKKYRFFLKYDWEMVQYGIIVYLY